MSDSKEILKAISEFKTEMNANFKSVNKRLDGIEYELKKIDTILHYTETYENIPS